MRNLRLVLPPSVLLLACLPVHADPSKEAPASGPVSYYRDVRPLFQIHCQGCHQPAKPQGGYVMTEHSLMLKAGESGKPAITPGQPAKSYLLDEIKVVDGKAEMPKAPRPAFNNKDYATVERWIKEGAKDDTPASAKAVAVDADHPPKYHAAPVVTSIAFSPDGKLLAVSGYHEVILHNADGSGIAGRLVGLSERVQSIAFSPNGKRLAVSGGDPGRFGEIQIWDVEKRKLLDSVPVTNDTVYGVSWSPDGSLIGFGCGDNTVRAIDATNGKQVLFMGTHSDWVINTTFSQDGQHLVSVSRDMTMKLTEVTTQRFIDNVTSITPGALKGGLMAVSLRPPKEKGKTTKVPNDDGGPGTVKVYDEVAVAGSDGIPRLYKIHRETKRVIGDDANKIRQYEPMTGRISTIEFDKDGKRFVAASSLDGKGEIRVYDTETGKFVAFEKVNGPIYTSAWSLDNKVVASSGFQGQIQFHDPATGKLLKEFVAVPLSQKSAKK